ncbi:hypothetical protein, partial [Peribacillus butanolivorans]
MNDPIKIIAIKLRKSNLNGYSQTVDKLDENEFVYSFFKGFKNSNVDWNEGHSLSAGGPGASS